MADSHSNEKKSRPPFPKRAIITGGMPYGNKDLHFGHIGGVFVQADVFARFLRDRIGKENVIFVSGTDCYGSPIVEHYRQVTASGDFKGTIDDFVKYNHNRQKEVLEAYEISLNLFAASSFSRSNEIHQELGAEILKTLHKNGHLVKLSTRQFYDKEHETFLNGRQVLGQCPIQGCASEKGYADECDLGHQYEPHELLNPKSTLSGKKPEMKEVTNWYLRLPDFIENLKDWVSQVEKLDSCRVFVVKSVSEFFEPPTIHITLKQEDQLNEIADKLPPFERAEGKSKSMRLVFKTLEHREKACDILTEHEIRFRNGKTLVPFRLTGNIEWGLPAPDIDDVSGLTFWVWPESLWAPVSFTSTYLEQQGQPRENWKDWWCSKDAQVYQFIGEDNVYFYGPAEMAMLMGMQGSETTAFPKDGDFQLPQLVVNNHILFLDKKASSSGSVKPPMARDLLEHYTADQLRAHFFSLGLNKRSVGFRPKPLNPAANEKEGDPVMKEGNLLSNVFNRAVRSCFYTMQTYYNGKLPKGAISQEVLSEAEDVILKFEEAMYRQEFNQAITVVDNYIRAINKRWTADMNILKEKEDDQLRKQTLIDAFHMVKVATTLMHPIAPMGTEMIRDYFNLGEDFWSWDRVFDSLYDFIPDTEKHEFKFLEPRVDFFEKHPSQVNY
ncbi:MAG: class I tRNA ligase family protein [Spirochaetales bacterium]|nr:class I tRNA ligase family protein [Spirochaetales bacterium]